MFYIFKVSRKGI